MKHDFTSIFCIEYGHKMCFPSVNRPHIIEYTVIQYIQDYSLMVYYIVMLRSVLSVSF